MFWQISDHGGARRAGGLLLLRIGLTLTLAHVALVAGPDCPVWARWLLAALIPALLLGLLSCPVAAASLLWLAIVPRLPWLLVAIGVALGLSVMLLGAGRWSLDRRLFGRRLVFESDDTFG